ncbi:DUF1569 domain-containing protein [Aridibaculum aurantiacum]|uniref:DUF1569 domain-containing protein n=1 Tax=Aridibaculum aurantiacum TaxID=2810307 RepID=UPI001A9674C1|nr:DUF1569 domain-containing protein [Aridibaculum aurantiacum]
MKKNLFDNNAKDEIVERIQQLQPSSKARWGTMNAAEMILHLRESLKLIIHATPSNKTSNLKQVITRYLFLHIAPRFPKEAGTPRQLDVKKSKMQVSDLAIEKQQLLQLLDVFVMQENIYAIHPYFGKLTRKDWGIFTWMHFDHHLRQFGV